MTTNMELYGREDIPNIPAHVADFRIQLLKERLDVLTSVHWMEQDTHLVNKVNKAILFWKRLKEACLSFIYH